MADRPKASLLRRAWPAVAIAGASAALVSALDSPAQLTAINPPAGSSPLAGGPTVVTAPPPVVTQPPAGPVDPGAAPPPTQGPPTSPAPVGGAAGACTAAPVDGPVEDTRWGPVQVEVVRRADGTICKADAIQTPHDRSRSLRINQVAVPILNESAVAAGNANFQGVSGATITSDGYQQSLQAILNGG